MWNLQKPILKTYNLINHMLINKKIKLHNNIYTINAVYKEWNNGWYLSLGLNEINNKYQFYFIKIPFQNINSSNIQIIQEINYINTLIEYIEE